MGGRKLKEFGCGSHHSPCFAIQLTAGHIRVLHSLKLQKVLFEISVLCQSVDTCLLLWSLRSKMFDKSHLWYQVKPLLNNTFFSHLLRSSIEMITQPPGHEVLFWWLFLHHFSGLQTSTDFSAARVLSRFYCGGSLWATCIISRNGALSFLSISISISLFVLFSYYCCFYYQLFNYVIT